MISQLVRFAAAFAAFASLAAGAQGFPVKPIRIIVPSGGNVDITNVKVE